MVRGARICIISRERSAASQADGSRGASCQSFQSSSPNSRAKSSQTAPGDEGRRVRGKSGGEEEIQQREMKLAAQRAE